MLPDDVFRTRLEATAADLALWAESVHDAADVVVSDGPGFWRLAVTPHVAGACPFELLLRADQKMDMTVAGETYEDRPVPPLDRLPVFVRAIEEGRVVERHWQSLDTGTPAVVETIVSPATGEAWRDEHLLVSERPATAPAPRLCKRDRHFLPYRRLTRS